MPVWVRPFRLVNFSQSLMSKETSRIDDSEYAHLEDVLANSGSPGERMEAQILLE
jgi:hypothetical protein